MFISIKLSSITFSRVVVSLEDKSLSKAIILTWYSLRSVMQSDLLYTYNIQPYIWWRCQIMVSEAAHLH